MELPSKLLKQIANNRRPKIEEHLLNVLDKTAHEEDLFQSLQNIDKQFKIAITFLTAYNGFFKVTNKNNKFYFAKSITDKDGFIQITVPQGAYEIESLNDESEKIMIDKGLLPKQIIHSL